jgi:hypothetical protein
MADESVSVVETPSLAVFENSTGDCDIAALAYRLWEERGRPDGDPEHDWYEAERLVGVRNGS